MILFLPQSPEILDWIEKKANWMFEAVVKQPLAQDKLLTGPIKGQASQEYLSG